MTLDKILDTTGLREEWMGPAPLNEVMNVHLDNTELHRLWRCANNVSTRIHVYRDLDVNVAPRR